MPEQTVRVLTDTVRVREAVGRGVMPFFLLPIKVYISYSVQCSLASTIEHFQREKGVFGPHSCVILVKFVRFAFDASGCFYTLLLPITVLRGRNELLCLPSPWLPVCATALS